MSLILGTKEEPTCSCVAEMIVILLFGCGAAGVALSICSGVGVISNGFAMKKRTCSHIASGGFVAEAFLRFLLG